MNIITGDTGTSSYRWYVVQTKPMSEDRVCRQFSSGALHLNDASAGRWSQVTGQNIEAFCPKIKCMAAGRMDGDGVRYKPLFPSYIFLRWDLGSPANHRLVKYTRGVNKVLGDGETAVPIPDEVVEIIRSRANEGGIIEQRTFKAGDLVRVRRGYLKDLIGVLERPVSDSGRVAVLLNLFNRQMRVHLSCREIAKA